MSKQSLVSASPRASRLRRYKLTNVTPVTNDAPCRAGVARTPDWLTAEPFMSQTATPPLLFCSTMSVLPSLLKSPVPTTCHAGPGSTTTPDLADLAADHLPNGDRAIVVLPQNVGLAVAVEVASIRRHASGARVCADHSRLAQLVAIHIPDRHRAIGVLQQDVTLAVLVEIARAVDVPAGAGVGDLGRTWLIWPFIHLPDGDIAIIFLQQHISAAVAIEVAGSRRCSRWSRIGDHIA